MLRSALIIGVAFALPNLASVGAARSESPSVSEKACCLACERPCGPDGIPDFVRRLIPQGCLGADFRCACRKHDKCYKGQCGSQKKCDLRFRDALLAECECSRNVLCCKIHARIMYCCVRLFGSRSYEK